MKRWRVMISAPYMQPVVEQFKPIFEANDIEMVIPTVHERLEESDLLAIIADIDGAITGDDRFTEKVIMAAPRLKVISKWGTGIDSIDREACTRHGVRIYNTPNAFSEPVADSVLGYMLCFARNIPWMDQQIKAGIWDKIPGRSLRESVIGIIGVGNVGKAVARRAVAFGGCVMGYDIAEVDQNFINQTGVQMVSLKTLLEQADYISINCDLNPTSFHLINKETLSQMKPTAVLINTARGPVVYERDLIEALQAGQLAGAGMDVFEDEPLPADSPLRQMDNVLLAPHNSNSSPLAWGRVHENTIQNLLRGLREE